jgi:purine-nucleoside phosphorylase
VSDLGARLDEGVAVVRKRTGLHPAIGAVLGSGLGGFADNLADSVAMPFTEIPHFPTSNVEGHAGALVMGRAGGVPMAVLKGRIHFYEGHSLADVVFPVRLLGRLGVRTLILTNAAGAINPAFQPGELMLLRDHVNLLGNPLVGPNEEELGPRFPDMSSAYVAMTGPSYETPAEIRMARTLGADAVGMSTVPEVIAARHMGMRVLALSCLTNMAAGVSGEPLDHREVLLVGERVRSTLIEILTRVVTEASEEA